MRLALPLCLLLVLVTGTARATGPSTVDIRLRPIAARNGAVLFRTYWQLNAMGGSDFQRTEFGWLVADARGGWEEVPHRTLEPDESGAGPWDEARRLFEEFNGPFDWDSPPASVAGLLRKHGFTRKDEVSPEHGKGTVTWKPKALCRGKRCGAPCRQRSLKGVRSVTTDAEPVEAAFVHSGLAVFHNRHEDPEGEPLTGARFVEARRPKAKDLSNFESLEYQWVAGICRVPR